MRRGEDGTFRIGKRFAFDAAHTAACGQSSVAALHGHTFTVEVRLKATELEPPGFVADFGVLSALKKFIDAELDHQSLDDVLKDPSADSVAHHLESWCRRDLVLPGGAQVDGVDVWAPAAPAAGRGLAAWETTFEAAHQLPGLPPGHKCGRLHGHSYAVGVLLPDGCPPWVLGRFGDHIARTLDHRSLNDALGELPATSENLARYLYDWCRDELRLSQDRSAVAVRVSETASTWAEYRG